MVGIVENDLRVVFPARSGDAYDAGALDFGKESVRVLRKLETSVFLGRLGAAEKTGYIFSVAATELQA